MHGEKKEGIKSHKDYFKIIGNINETWYIDEMIEKAITKIEIPNYATEYEKKEILDDTEREYLNNIIKPFRDKVICIQKRPGYVKTNYEYIAIIIDGITGTIEDLDLPFFKKNTMYKGMKIYERYTLEELGLQEENK